MAINLGMGFKVGNMEPIDARFIMSKAEMLAVTPATQPDVYFCVCSDDSLMYVYNSSNSEDAATGKFRCVSTGAFDMTEYQKVIDDALTTVDKTVPGAINELLNLINEKVALPELDGVENDVLTRDADGNVIWKAIPDVDLSGKLDKPAVDGTAGQILVLQDDGSLAYQDNVSEYDDTAIQEALNNKLDKDKVVQDLTAPDTESVLSTEATQAALDTKVDKVDGSSLVADTEIAKIHEHTNQDVLDNLTKDVDSGKLLFEGNPISVDVPVATVDIVGTVKPDGTTITVADDGTITAVGGGTAGGDVADFVSNTVVGAIQKNTDLSGKTSMEILKMALVSYVNPSATVSYSQSNTVLKKGQSFDLTITVSGIVKGTNDVAELILIKDGTVLETIPYVTGTNSYEFAPITGINTECSFQIKVGDTQGKQYSTSKTYSFVDPYYIGATDNIPTADTVLTLTELIEAKSNKTKKVTATDQYVVYAYPTSYGSLTSIIDGNGFENLTDYTKISLTINEVAYTCYHTIGKKSMVDFSYTYKY